MSIGGGKPESSAAAGDGGEDMIASVRPAVEAPSRARARVGFCVELDDAILDEVEKPDESVLRFLEDREASRLLTQDSGHMTEASYDLAWDRDRGWSRNRTLNISESDHSLPLDVLNTPLNGDLSDSMLEEICGIGDFTQRSFEIDELDLSSEFLDHTEPLAPTPCPSKPSQNIVRRSQSRETIKPGLVGSKIKPISPSPMQDNPLVEDPKTYRRFGVKKHRNELLTTSSESVDRLCPSEPRITLSDISIDVEDNAPTPRSQDETVNEENARPIPDSHVRALEDLLQSLRVDLGGAHCESGDPAPDG